MYHIRDSLTLTLNKTTRTRQSVTITSANSENLSIYAKFNYRIESYTAGY